MLHVVIALTIAAQTQNLTSVSDGLVYMSDVTFAEVGNEDKHQLLMDVVFPVASSDPLPVVIYIHGGGWSQGRRQDGKKAIKMFAQGGYFATTIDYRLTQQMGFPNAVHDCKAAIRFIRNNADELGINPAKIALVGYSAGGYLAALVGVSSGIGFLDGPINGPKVSTNVTCIGSISGAVMPQLARGRGKQIYETWALGVPDIQIADTLPITYLDENDPPIYLLCGEEDNICPVNLTRQFATLIMS